MKTLTAKVAKLFFADATKSKNAKNAKKKPDRKTLCALCVDLTAAGGLCALCG